MLPSDMNLKIRLGTVGHNNKILVPDEKFSLGKTKILKMSPPSIQKFDLEDTGNLVAIVAASEITREYQTEDLTRSHKRMRKWRV